MEPSISRRWFWIFFLGAMVIHGIYYHHTDPQARAYDAAGHLDYISLIRQQHQLPYSGQCWQCYHPPLYYLSAAALLGAVPRLPPNVQENILQGYSLFLFVIFLFISKRIIELSTSDLKSRLLAFAFLLYWPAGFIHGCRIGNDGLLYLFEAASLLMLTRWNNEGEARIFVWAGFWAALALFTKANGLLSSVTIAVVFLYRERGHIVESLQRYRAGVACVVLGVISFLFVYWIKGALTTNLYELPRVYFVKDSLSSFLGFGWRPYLNYPFISSWDDDSGRRYLWNFLLKSSLFGEYESFNPPVRAIALTGSSLLLGVVAVVLIGFRLAWTNPERRILGIFTTVSLVGALAYRLTSHSAGAMDFRYIYPTVIAGAVFFAAGNSWLAERAGRFGRVVPAALLGLFLALTGGMVLFF